MDYRKIYDALIERAQSRIITGYVEKHHITPRCLQGTDDPLNIVELTAREHYLAHLLLVKLHPGNHKLIYAAAMMCGNIQNNGHRLGNRLYEWLRIQRSAAMSELHKGKIVSEETRQKLREKNKNYRPTEDAKRRSREAQIGHTVSEETRAKISAANMGGKTRTGQKSTEEHKRKISESQKGKILTEEHKKRLSVANKDRKPSRCSCILCRKEVSITLLSRHVTGKNCS